MSATKKIKKDDIVQAGIEIIRNDGILSLNARKIAQKLNCSTQPIFYIYSNMQDVKNDIINVITKMFNDSIIKSNYDRIVYKDIGINYIKFAKEEPELFKVLFNSTYNMQVLSFMNLTSNLNKINDIISKQTGLSKEKAKKFHLKMWLYVNGIANLVANNTCNFTKEEIEKLLEEQYISMLLLEIQKGNIKKEILDNVLKNKLKRRD